MMAHLGVVHVNGDTTGDFQTLLGTLVTDGVMDHHFAFTLLEKRTRQEMTEQNPPAQAHGYGATQQQPNQIQLMFQAMMMQQMMQNGNNITGNPMFFPAVQNFALTRGDTTQVHLQPTGNRGRKRNKISNNARRMRIPAEIQHQAHVTKSDYSTVTSASTLANIAYTTFGLPMLSFHDDTIANVPEFLNSCLPCPSRNDKQSSSWIIKKGCNKLPKKTFLCQCHHPFQIRAHVKFLEGSYQKEIQLEAPVTDGIPEIPHPVVNGSVELKAPTIDEMNQETVCQDVIDFIDDTYNEEPLLLPTSVWLRIRHHQTIGQLMSNTEDNFRALVRLMKSSSWSRRNPPGPQLEDQITNNNALLNYINLHSILKYMPSIFDKLDPGSVTSLTHLCQLYCI